MVTPRRTRLVRAPALPAFQDAIARAVAEADPECAVLVPSRGAAAHLRRTLAVAGAGRPQGAKPAPAALLTRGGFHAHLHARLTSPPRLVTEVEREALARAAARDAVRAGAAPPFRLRPGLVRLMLGFYDDLARHGRSVDAFERLAVEDLEPSVPVDRGARRLLDQTRFLAAAFRALAARTEAAGALDEHRLRTLLLAAPPARPLRDVIVTVADRTAQAAGLYPADFDLLARLPRLARVTLIATDAVLDAGFRERLEDLLPGLEEERAASPARQPPALVVPRAAPAPATAASGSDGGGADGRGAVAPGSDGGGADGRGAVASGSDGGGADGERCHFVWRDREEELRWVAGRAAAESAPAEGAALVVQRPLPYLYLASSVSAEHRLALAVHDGLPLATEPYAAAVDLVLACVREDFAREPLVALLGSPQLAFGETAGSPDAGESREVGSSRDAGESHEVGGSRDAAGWPETAESRRAGGSRGAAVEALDRELVRRRFTGGADNLRALDREWTDAPPRAGTRAAAARPAAAWAVEVAAELAALAAPAPPADGLDVLLAFLERHDAAPRTDASSSSSSSSSLSTDAAAPRDERVRAGIRAGLAALRDAAAALPEAEPDTDAGGLADLVRQWIEAQPGPVPPAPSAPALHLVDAQAAPYGRFRDVYLAGLVDGEWPPPPPRSVFYPAAMLAGLGWPRERARLRAGRAAFRDLLGLARSRVALSAFALEDDAVVTRSVWLDDVPDAGLTRVADEERAAGADPAPAVEWLAWRRRRAARPAEDAPDPDGRGPYAVSALDRYLECPFKYFAQHVLALEPDGDDEGAFTPRQRGVFVHRVFEAFFAAWQAAGEGAITLGSVERALARFREVADAELARLPPADRAVAGAWILGSAVAPGLAERLFMAEVEQPADLVERRLEVRLDGSYDFDGPAGPRRLALRGTADRIDLHADRSFRLLDYKAERPPRAVRSLQLPVYAACAERRFADRRGRWRAGGAAYVAFGDPRLEVPAAGDDIAAAMRAGARRAVEVVEAIERGTFPPRPADASRCRHCPFPTVCRKDDAVSR